MEYLMLESERKGIAADFTKLAERFRRAATIQNGSERDVESAAAIGGKLLAKACELFDPQIQAIEPKPEQLAKFARQPDVITQLWAAHWTFVVCALGRFTESFTIPNPLALRSEAIGGPNDIVHSRTDGGDWRLRAENYASICDWLAGELAADGEPPSPRIAVDLACRTVTLNGTPHDVSSANACRWVAVLAEHLGEWISSTELEGYDNELVAVRTDKLRKHLPKNVDDLIESDTGKGSRLRLT
jgi:hypothetical protein